MYLDLLLTISFVTGSLFLRREVTTSTTASRSFGNLNNSYREKQGLLLHLLSHFVYGFQ